LDIGMSTTGHPHDRPDIGMSTTGHPHDRPDIGMSTRAGHRDDRSPP